MLKDCEISKESMNIIYKIIGNNVKRVREEKGVSQLNLALAIGHKAVGVISHSEICIQNKHFNIEHLIRIADVLDVNIKDFFVNI
jgi:transcriptional regulator with XRE-family HTH domain|tara:strand:+ start:759 stop:1013 length:255 start_codon:yes stop_codon:yes gene_type:complete